MIRNSVDSAAAAPAVPGWLCTNVALVGTGGNRLASQVGFLARCYREGLDTVTNSIESSLLFLISQPRTGSTMLQLTLGKHREIHTQPEPWILLHPLYGLRKEGIIAEYEHRRSNLAVAEFFQHFPEGEEAYWRGVRRMYGELYQDALERAGKRIFLDKTPRYYLVASELHRTFPNARYLILYRNPLAILCSYLRLIPARQWFMLRAARLDLIQGPAGVALFAELASQASLVISYEEVVADPEYTLRSVCEWLDIGFDGGMLADASGIQGASLRLGDPYAWHSSRPIRSRAQAWEEMLCDPQVWRFAQDYLEFLGRRTVSGMGYDYDRLQEILDDSRPPLWQAKTTLPLWAAMLSVPPFMQNAPWMRARGRIIQHLSQVVDRAAESLALRAFKGLDPQRGESRDRRIALGTRFTRTKE